MNEHMEIKKLKQELRNIETKYFSIEASLRFLSAKRQQLREADVYFDGKVFKLKDALEEITDDSIANDKHSDQTLIDLRDAIIELLRSYDIEKDRAIIDKYGPQK